MRKLVSVKTRKKGATTNDPIGKTSLVLAEKQTQMAGMLQDLLADFYYFCCIHNIAVDL